MIAMSLVITELARPFEEDLENLHTYREYLGRCSKSTFLSIRNTSKSLLKKTDGELEEFLEGSRLFGKHSRILQENMYAVPMSKLKELGLPTLDVRLAKPYPEDIENMETYRAYLERCSTSKIPMIARSATRMLELPDEELEQFLLESRGMGKYIQVEQKDM